MTKDEIIMFKNELKNYNLYKKKIILTQDLIDRCYYLLGGCRGISYDKQSVTPNPELTSEQLHRVYDEIDRHKSKIAKLQGKIDDIDEILDKLKPSVKMALIDLYANDYSYKKTSAKLNYSPSSLFKIINRELKKI